MLRKIIRNSIVLVVILALFSSAASADFLCIRARGKVSKSGSIDFSRVFTLGSTGCPSGFIPLDLGTLINNLPSGRTITGVFTTDLGSGGVLSDQTYAGISFQLSLADPPVPQFVPAGVTTTECQGSAFAPTATRGNLCVYADTVFNANFLGFSDGATAFPNDTPFINGAILVFTRANPALNFFANGAWAVTAP